MRIIIGLSVMVILITGAYLYSQYDPEDHILFPKCPIYTLTGYKCPGCGSQRALHNLFHGNFLTAFIYNPLMILLMPYILLGIYIEYIANKRNNLTIRLRKIFFEKWAILVFAVVILSYTILRNVF